MCCLMHQPGMSHSLRLLFVAVSFLRAGGPAAAADEVPAPLPEAVSHFLRWLPVDTETIIVARSFVTLVPDQNAKPDWEQVRNISLIPEDLSTSPATLLFRGRRIKLAVKGGRSFESVSAFGSLRFAGCSIIEFEDPWLGKDLLDSLKKNAKSVRRIGDRDAFVFPDQTVMESFHKLKEWQGLFITVLSPSIVLCATSDAYLRELLERIAEDQPLKRALPAELPEWKYVDPQAPCWAIRNIPGNTRGRQVIGLVWALKPRGREVFEVTYLSPHDADATKLVHGLWQPATIAVHPTIQSKDDGTTVVTIDTREANIFDWYALPIYASEGEQGLGE